MDEFRYIINAYLIMSVFTIRNAHQNDAAGMAKVHVDTWRAAYQGIIPDNFLETLSYQSTAERWRETFGESGTPWRGNFCRRKRGEGR
jgi:hypothetical protein